MLLDEPFFSLMECPECDGAGWIMESDPYVPMASPCYGCDGYGNVRAVGVPFVDMRVAYHDAP